MDKFKKIDKEFLLTDSSLNCYGYRLLTAGYLLDEFKKNPIGYHMHADAQLTDFTRKDGVLVKWSDFRTDGDKVFAKPNINLSHPRGQRTIDEVESGFLNAASMGHFVIIEVSSKPEDYLADQKGISASKWFNRECSLVDIPGNFNALTDLYDVNDNPLKLEDLFAKNNFTMKQINFTTAQLAALTLSADADAAAVETAFNNLVAKAAKVDQLTNDLAAANTEKKTAVDALDALKKTTVDNEVRNLVEKGVTDKKITVEVGNQLKAVYAEKPTELKALIDALPAYQSITAAITTGAEAAKDLASKSWEELDKSGKLEDLKAQDPETFKAKYKAKFNKEYGA